MPWKCCVLEWCDYSFESLPVSLVGNVVGLAVGLTWCNGKAPCVVIQLQVYASTLTTTACSGLILDSPNICRMTKPFVSTSVHVHVWMNTSSRPKFSSRCHWVRSSLVLAPWTEASLLTGCWGAPGEWTQVVWKALPAAWWTDSHPVPLGVIRLIYMHNLLWCILTHLHVCVVYSRHKSAVLLNWFLCQYIPFSGHLGADMGMLFLSLCLICSRIALSLTDNTFLRRQHGCMYRLLCMGYIWTDNVQTSVQNPHAVVGVQGIRDSHVQAIIHSLLIFLYSSIYFNSIALFCLTTSTGLFCVCVCVCVCVCTYVSNDYVR